MSARISPRQELAALVVELADHALVDHLKDAANCGKGTAQVMTDHLHDLFSQTLRFFSLGNVVRYDEQTIVHPTARQKRIDNFAFFAHEPRFKFSLGSRT